MKKTSLVLVVFSHLLPFQSSRKKGAQINQTGVIFFLKEGNWNHQCKERKGKSIMLRLNKTKCSTCNFVIRPLRIIMTYSVSNNGGFWILNTFKQWTNWLGLFTTIMVGRALPQGLVIRLVWEKLYEFLTKKRQLESNITYHPTFLRRRRRRATLVMVIILYTMMIRQQDMTTNNDNIGDSKISRKKAKVTWQ